MLPRGRPERRRRTLAFALALLGCCLFAWLAVQVYRSRIDPQGFGSWGGAYGWIVGPSAEALNDAALAQMDRGLRILNDTSLPPDERIGGYREQLVRAEKLLLRSLRAQPAQAQTLAQLAAVRWELDPPLEQRGVARHVELIELAAEMAPAVSRVQLQLGELLLKMGREDEAYGYLRRSIELAPATSRRVVEILDENLVSAREMLAALPHRPQTLVALQEPFFAEAAEADYLAAVEPLLSADSVSEDPRLLACYANASLRLGRADQLRERLDRLGDLGGLEAQRIYQRSRAWRALRRPEQAIEDARQARRLQSDSVRFAEHLGGLLLADGDAAGAIREFRHALALLARREGQAPTRARLYRRVGEAEERRGAAARAYDAYRRAVEIDPHESVAARRMREMEAAAGLRSGSP